MSGANTFWKWICTGDEMFAAMLAAIEAARTSVRLESYIYAAGEPGEGMRAALIRAVGRGVKVRVLIDGLGSIGLAGDFWKPLHAVGGEARVFNPVGLKRFGLRNHRKLLVCDDELAFVGGFNVAPEYVGDGVKKGWCDLGLCLTGKLVPELAASFDEMFKLADFQHKRFMRFRKTSSKRAVVQPKQSLLLSGPGRGRNPFKRALWADLKHARKVSIIVAYFLPSRTFWRALARVVKRGGKAELILPGKSDVALSQLAGRSLYRRLMWRRVNLFEYQPQILHAKLFVVDDVVYVGSSNLDPRSLGINYELMLRFENAAMAREAREIFGDVLKHSDPVEMQVWKSRSLWTRLKQRWAFFVLSRVDPFVARRQWRALPD